MPGKITGIAKTREVTFDGKRLDPGPSQKVRNHSPDGFAWGYEGSGPAQLALAILLEILPEPAALAHYQEFKRQWIADLPSNEDFILDIGQICMWLSLRDAVTEIEKSEKGERK